MPLDRLASPEYGVTRCEAIAHDLAHARPQPSRAGRARASPCLARRLLSSIPSSSSGRRRLRQTARNSSAPSPISAGRTGCWFRPGSLVALALVLRRRHLGFRNAAGYGLIASTIGFVFVSVGGAGLIANLTKYILGRARPKLFETTGPLDFQLFAFDPDYASFPSGHATNIFALATVLGILWPTGQGAALHGCGLDCVEPGADRPALFYRCGWGGDSRDGVPVYRAGTICYAALAV